MPLKGLNWRKGLFRLWLFSSALWIVTMGIFCLYPATSRYIEGVKAAHGLETLRASISYKFLEEPHNKSHSDTSGQTPPLPSKVSPREALPGTRTDKENPNRMDGWL